MPTRTPQEVVRLYRRGVITEAEMVVALLRTLEANNIGPFFASAAPDLRKDLKNHAAKMPTTERGWSEMVTIDTRIWRGDLGEGHRQRILQEESRLHRRGVEVLRAFLARPQEERVT